MVRRDVRMVAITWSNDRGEAAAQRTDPTVENRYDVQKLKTQMSHGLLS